MFHNVLILPGGSTPESSILFCKKHHPTAELCVGCGLTWRRDPCLRNGFDCNSIALIAGGQHYVVSAGLSVAICLASIAVTDASKIALVDHLRARKFALLDTQWLTPHLQQFGGIEISRDNYLRLLRRAVELPREF